MSQRNPVLDRLPAGLCYSIKPGKDLAHFVIPKPWEYNSLCGLQFGGIGGDHYFFPKETCAKCVKIAREHGYAISIWDGESMEERPE